MSNILKVVFGGALFGSLLLMIVSLLLIIIVSLISCSFDIFTIGINYDFVRILLSGYWIFGMFMVYNTNS